MSGPITRPAPHPTFESDALEAVPQPGGLHGLGGGISPDGKMPGAYTTPQDHGQPWGVGTAAGMAGLGALSGRMGAGMGGAAGALGGSALSPYLSHMTGMSGDTSNMVGSLGGAALGAMAGNYMTSPKKKRIDEEPKYASFGRKAARAEKKADDDVHHQALPVEPSILSNPSTLGLAGGAAGALGGLGVARHQGDSLLTGGAAGALRGAAIGTGAGMGSELGQATGRGLAQMWAPGTAGDMGAQVGQVGGALAGAGLGHMLSNTALHQEEPAVKAKRLRDRIEALVTKRKKLLHTDEAPIEL